MQSWGCLNSPGLSHTSGPSVSLNDLNPPGPNFSQVPESQLLYSDPELGASLPSTAGLFWRGLDTAVTPAPPAPNCFPLLGSSLPDGLLPSNPEGLDPDGLDPDPKPDGLEPDPSPDGLEPDPSPDGLLLLFGLNPDGLEADPEPDGLEDDPNPAGLLLLNPEEDPGLDGLLLLLNPDGLLLCPGLKPDDPDGLDPDPKPDGLLLEDAGLDETTGLSLVGCLDPEGLLEDCLKLSAGLLLPPDPNPLFAGLNPLLLDGLPPDDPNPPLLGLPPPIGLLLKAGPVEGLLDGLLEGLKLPLVAGL